MTSSKSPKLKPTLWDAVVVAAVIILGVAVAVIFYGDKTASHDLCCTVAIGGETVETIPLPKESAQPVLRIYENRGYTLHVSLTSAGVCVSDSDCPSQDCVHTGTITRSGQSIVCLPAQIVIQLTGQSDGPDVIVG